MKWAYSSEPIDSTTSIRARNVEPRCFNSSLTTAASSKFSGRMPAISCLPAVWPTASAASRGSRTSPTGSFTLSPSTVAGMKFMAGEPMNPATNRLFGWLYSSIGEPTCWSRPARMTATRSPSVIASVWSCVT